MMTRRSFFTTFEISQICEVNPTTVQNWVKEKKLKAFVTPGRHRRIQREDLVEFLRRFGMPIPEKLAVKSPLVLIVDDEATVREMLGKLFKSGKESIEVVSAHNGVEALLLIGERRPEVLILDIKMPGMNGFEVCRQLRASERNQYIKIVAITGDSDPTIRSRILEAGADLFFTKPLKVLEFRTEVLKLLGF